MIEALITLCGRGGSRGLKNKNIRPLCGIPLIAWTLFDAEKAFENAKDIRKTVAVDSDSDLILETAQHFSPNIRLHKRREDLAGDRVAKMAVIGEVFRDISAETGKRFDLVIDLDITSPLRTGEDIENAANLFFSEKRDVIFSVAPSRRNPYFNMVERNGSGKFALSKASDFVARQQAPEVFDMNASLYIYKPDVFSRGVLSPVSVDFGIYEMRDYGVIDIDDEADLKLMELILRYGDPLLSEGLRRKKAALTSCV
ncbi:acylneuraminate cytidylyltransferase family protein [Aminivibrio sp.]